MYNREETKKAWTSITLTCEKVMFFSLMNKVATGKISYFVNVITGNYRSVFIMDSQNRQPVE